MAGIVIQAFERTAAGRGFGKMLEAGVQCRQPLVHAHVARRLGECSRQWPDRLVGQVIREEQVRIGHSGAHRDRQMIRIGLVDHRRRCLQVLHNQSPFFGRDLADGG